MNENPTPKVSVIIPNYNHEKYLKKRIDTVLAQSYQNFEIWYLDDASTDQSEKIFDGYADNSRICALINQKNSGSAFKQWNKGVAQAGGEYIWIAEADDYADPKLLETLVDLLDQNPKVGIAFCRSSIVDENDDFFTPSHREEYDGDPLWNENFIMNGKEYALQYMVHANTIPNASAVLFRKDVYLQTGGGYEKLRLAGDWLTWLRMLKQSDIAYVSQPLNYFRSHSATVRSRSVKAGLWAEEKYRVANYIARNLALSADELEKLRHKSMEIWQYAIYDRQTQIGYRRSARIFRLARRLDSKAPLRFVRHTAYRWLHSTPLFSLARSLGRALWRLVASSRS